MISVVRQGQAYITPANECDTNPPQLDDADAHSQCQTVSPIQQNLSDLQPSVDEFLADSWCQDDMNLSLVDIRGILL